LAISSEKIHPGTFEPVRRSIPSGRRARDRRP
jgi:hypothetical protein